MKQLTGLGWPTQGLWHWPTKDEATPLTPSQKGTKESINIMVGIVQFLLYSCLSPKFRQSHAYRCVHMFVSCRWGGCLFQAVFVQGTLSFKSVLWIPSSMILLMKCPFQRQDAFLTLLFISKMDMIPTNFFLPRDAVKALGANKSPKNLWCPQALLPLG